eukprot:XP_027304731.1 proline-rich receptor-like protein kinase PERK2 isoform X2 [Anas platyrhynchos]
MGPRPPPAAQRVPLKDPPTTGTPSDALLLQRATGRPPPVPATHSSDERCPPPPPLQKMLRVQPQRPRSQGRVCLQTEKWQQLSLKAETCSYETYLTSKAFGCVDITSLTNT